MLALRKILNLSSIIALLAGVPGVFAQTPGQAEPEPEPESLVALGLDANSTNDMHDDTTLLRNVATLEDETSLMFFDALRIWVGGTVQYDYYNFDGIYNHSGEGERREGGSMRRLEGILRSSLYDWGEIKAQYDFDAGIFRDLYLRWVSEKKHTPLTVTMGNQKEPMGLDRLIGNKFGIAQERSAPSHAFGNWSSLGVRLHKAFQVEGADRPLDIFDDEAAFITTSVGLFTQDIEDNHDTDWAITGRVTAGRERDGEGIHVGLSASYREGGFDRVSFRPEVQEADRIILSQPRADTLGIVGLEGAYNRGPLHLQAEAYYSYYQGKVDGYGGGGYLQAGWFITGESRNYNPRWGILAPHSPAKKISAEIFARVSHTRGDDDIDDWNDFASLTLGANLWYHKFRGSLNVLYGDSRDPIGTEDEGLAVNVRVQYLF